MTDFTQIHAAAISIWGEDELQYRLAKPATRKTLLAREDNEYLSLMSRRIFRAGLRHSVVDAKWPAFEKAFKDFDIDIVRMFSDEQMEAFLNDKTIIRHWGKIKSVRHNAQAIYDLSPDDNRVGQYLADWPVTETVALWEDMKKRFKQLGGNSGPYFLRMAGRDTFVLTNDVIRGLNSWGAFNGTPTGKKARQQIQEAFNLWHEQTKLPLCQLSLILAMSTV